MSLKLIPPQGKQKSFYIRGTYLGCYVNQSTKTDRKDLATKILAVRKLEIERGVVKPGGKRTTFLTAAVGYMSAGGEVRPVHRLIEYFGETPIDEIDQAAIDAAAAELFPDATAATRNREVYTPVAAVLHRAGIKDKFMRPKGWKGKRSLAWLRPDQAFAIFDAADEIEPEFGLFLRTLCYTGMRLGEALSVRMRHVSLKDQSIYLTDTKNGLPRPVFLPSHLVVALANQPARTVSPGHFGRTKEDIGVPFMERAAGRRLFRFANGGRLRKMLKLAFEKCGLEFPRREGGFHIFCHTYGTWMKQFAELSTDELVRTGRWRTPNMADRYIHTMPGAEAMKANLLPAPAKKIAGGK